MLFIAKPLWFIWKIVLRPIIIVVYKIYLVLKEKWRRFFHAQHKILAVLTHRLAIHVFVVILTMSIVFVNVVQAKSVRSDNFLQESLLTQIVAPNNEYKITADTIIPVNTSYIDTSSAVKVTPLGEDSKNAVANITTTGNGGAVLGQTILEGNTKVNTEKTSYTVKEGDTASTIAAKFGVSTKTVLWSNNLDDPDMIKPGDTLDILPVSGLEYTVREGDTVDSIAEKYEATAEDIVDFNKLVNKTEIKVGENIIIPGGKKEDPPPPPPPTQTQLASIKQVFGSNTTSTTNTTTATVQNIPTTSGQNVTPNYGASGQWPTVTHRMSQYYGYGHTGIDIDGEFGDPIYASDGGKVISAGSEGAYGIAVRIQHANGIVTHYAHLQSLGVSAGQQVGRGQYLGQMGSTGRSTGSHLHYEVIVNGRFVNPYTYTK
ncbi:MAG: hypothetical protein A2233_04335 [Candidatus Kerfeldbacteria bacterium RIFOXYA2_FULL_38_24]|uniref:LysM domain-containing protein n=1 Tax=Candidatus Kerfeldbacteria bacterium RIFOXYB2_FULL_38_14 TaxID=1798547 RepID=A0A1G2BE38_9BACT|nr:MAG: hypothetical protein A2233_04335 [Candidatus Kerfeldbacteria bacterium RIFOXYA2_FULL_38_24]OGY86946.1 MAG: hypothetical protein A2319_00180 [Candidatus Kerfeldbacteria bacterium RIFOXYB2_FULL_38_14]